MTAKEYRITKIDVGNFARFAALITVVTCAVICAPFTLLSMIFPIVGIFAIVFGVFWLAALGVVTYAMVYLQGWMANKILERYPLALEMDDGAPEAKRTAKRKSR